MSLTVVTVPFNVKELIKNAIKSVYKTYKAKDLQIIAIDNGTDGTAAMLKKSFPKVKVVEPGYNSGFAKGNNFARKFTKGDTVLFLNCDTEVEGRAIEKSLAILKDKKEVGAVTVKVMLPNGKLDYSCHRGLPTPWNTFCYWTGLSRIFPKTKIFSGYKATYLNTNKNHYIDCASGTFLMVRRSLLDKIGWWDEGYWWNGEDIELCYQIKKAGYKIWYEASETIIHYKGSSSGLWSTGRVKVAPETKKRAARAAAEAMMIFINKHWKELGPWPIMVVVRLGIWLLEKYRLWKIDTGLSYQ